MDVEDRIFHLSGHIAPGQEIAAIIAHEYEMDFDEAWGLVLKVRRERSTPNRIRAKQSLERYCQISFI